MRILVTGGAGFIGSALVLHLVGNLAVQVLNLDKLTYAGNLESLAAIADRPNYRFVQADICDEQAVAEAFESFRPDVVMHLAAESHVDRSILGARAFVDTNVTGTFVMLEAARHYWLSLADGPRAAFRFLHVSTDEVFGCLGDDGAFGPGSYYNPSSPYSATKAASDHMVRAWHRTYGLPVVLTNCSNNYGPRQFPEKLLPLHIINAIEGLPLPIYGDGCQVRDWLHVEDHVAALYLAATRGQPGETYFVGGRNEWRNRDIVAYICAILDELRPGGAPHERLITFVTDRSGHDYRYAVDPVNTERGLGWRACHTFHVGLEATVHWYLENEAWWQPLRQRVYGGSQLDLANG